MLRVIDVSAYQPTNYKPPAGTHGMFVKATEGTKYTSPAYPTQMNNARKLTQFQGAYHFARPEESTAKVQYDRFVSVAKPKSGLDIIWNDLEASQLSQKKTRQWAIDFANRSRDRYPDNPVGLYMGGGYATNGTGEGLAEYYDVWWYPQYPTVYHLNASGEEFWRLMNRSHYTEDRVELSTPSSLWPQQFNPWLPGGAKDNTGWVDGPDFWQFTDHHLPGKVDASISPLTVEQILNAGKPAPSKEDQWFLATST
jgi:hypothetical protein